jgi:hypothetical protein
MSPELSREFLTDLVDGQARVCPEDVRQLFVEFIDLKITVLSCWLHNTRQALAGHYLRLRLPVPRWALGRHRPPTSPTQAPDADALIAASSPSFFSRSAVTLARHSRARVSSARARLS